MDRVRRLHTGHGAVAETALAGYPPIDIKFMDRPAYCNAFDEYHGKHNLSAMEKLFAGYLNERLDLCLAIPQET